jgi:hypothetical protein
MTTCGLEACRGRFLFFLRGEQSDTSVPHALRYIAEIKEMMRWPIHAMRRKRGCSTILSGTST